MSLPPQEEAYQLAHKDDNRSADVVAAVTICLVAAFVAVFLRFLSRKLSKAPLGADDWMIVVGLVRLL